MNISSVENGGRDYRMARPANIREFGADTVFFK